MNVNGISIQANATTDQISAKIGQFLKRPVQQIDPNLSAFIKELPQDGFVDLGEFLHIQPKIRHWNEDIDSLDKLSLSHVVAVTTRLAATVFLGRIFCVLGTCYHVLAGSSKLFVAVTEYKNETKEKAAIVFKNAIHHFLLAVYNGVASLPSINYLIAGTYAIAPQWLEGQHNYFAGTEKPIDLKNRQIIDAKRKELEALNCPQLVRATGACIDAAGPYGVDGQPIELPPERKALSVISQKAEELATQWIGKLEQV